MATPEIGDDIQGCRFPDSFCLHCSLHSSAKQVPPFRHDFGRCRLIWVQFQPWRLRFGSVLAFTAHVGSQLTAWENLEDCMPTGKIKMFDEGRGFGFIKPDDGGVDVFFHVSALRDGDEITQGKAVKFEIGVDPKSGKTKAVSVDLA
jgi:cold shock protein